jgi:dual specificity phosphatase 3
MMNTPHSLHPADWHRRLCDIEMSLIVSGDLPADPSDALDHLAGWQAANVTHVLDCRGEWSDETLVATFAPDMAYCWVGTDDRGLGQPDEFWDAGAAFGREAAADTNSRLLVHCHMGINRGPSMAFRILLDRGWDEVDALDAIRSVRPIAAIIYADSAFDHHARLAGLPTEHHRDGLGRITDWHRRNPIDLNWVISQVRLGKDVA